MTRILFVAAEAIIGAVCPLTILEDMLRGRTTQAGFIQRWVEGLIYYDLPGWVFTVVYVLFALVVLVTFRRVPPHR